MPQVHKQPLARGTRALSTVMTEKPKKRSRLLVYSVLIALFFFGIVYIVWLFLQEPVIGEVRIMKKELTEDRNSTKKQKQYQGEYLTFSYPGIYAEKAHEIFVDGPVKESIFLSAADIEGKKLAIVVEEREGGDFAASSSFQMRSNKPTEYDQKPVSIGGQSGILFKKDTQMFERIFFLHSEDFLISISATSPFSAESLEQELFSIIGSIRFR